MGNEEWVLYEWVSCLCGLLVSSCVCKHRMSAEPPHVQEGETFLLD